MGNKIILPVTEQQLVALGAAIISYQRDYPNEDYVNRTYHIAEKLGEYYVDALAHCKEVFCPTDN